MLLDTISTLLESMLEETNSISDFIPTIFDGTLLAFEAKRHETP
jgi:hypothetical protein